MSRTAAPRRPARPAPRSSDRGPARPRQGRIRQGNPQRRGMLLVLVTAIVLSLFAVRLVDLQAIRGDALAGQALDQRLRTVTLPALRGAIMDNAGNPLAITLEARNVTADQTLIADPVATAAALAPVLNADPGALAERLTGDRRFVYIAKAITPETWDRISELELAGIFSEAAARRIYPAGDLAANVVGFVGAEGNGLGGLEYSMDTELAGVAGSATYERGPGGKVIPTGNSSTTAATAGTSIKLTIDRDIQFMAQRAIAKKVQDAYADSGTVVVMDPKTGHILALATAPTFDPNKPGAADAADRGNRALTNVFEPGSTAKVMTLAAVVNEGKANPYSSFTVPGALTRADKDFHDHNPHGTLGLTLSGIMAKSSNIGTILAAERIGGKKLYKYLKKFGIGEDTGLNFPAEQSGFVPKHSDWSPTSFPTIAFGQGLSLNAVQAASIFATIANDGVRVQPSLVSEYVDADGNATPAPASKTTQVVSADAARQVRAMLETVVGEGGTAPMAAIPGYRVGGKTGTAQAVGANGGYDGTVISSFIGMAPVDAPELVVAVTIFNPRAGRFGGELGGPVFKDVMSYALQARAVPPTGTQAPRLPLTFGG